MKKWIISLSICTLVACSTLTIPITNADEFVPESNKDIRMVAKYGDENYFDMTISNVPDGYYITNGYYAGWCVQKELQMILNSSHSVILYSSLNISSLPPEFNDMPWDKINYIINHKTGYTRNSIQNAIWNFTDDTNCSDDLGALELVNAANAYNGSYIPTIGDKLAIPILGKKTIQLTFLELVIPQPTPPNGDPTPPPPEEPPVNKRPTAATAGEPYRGFINGTITFDGSPSYDIDGRIISWRWDFGDGNNGTGEITTHVYTVPGIYNVSLVVMDNNFATDTYTTTALITLGNNPPGAPAIAGPLFGRSTVSYEYTIIAIDPDGDNIKYFVEWGDGTKDNSSFVMSGTSFQTSHQWNAPGFYIIKTYAQDTYDEISEIYQIRIAIDVTYVASYGYLIDQNSDGIFDVFHNNETGIETTVSKQTNGNYLIDTNGDGQWDMEYNPGSGQTQEYQEQTILEYAILFLIIAVIALIVVYYILKSRKKS